MIKDLVIKLVEENELRRRNRKRRNVNQRCFLINKMREYGYTYRDICSVFELTHASVVHAKTALTQAEEIGKTLQNKLDAATLDTRTKTAEEQLNLS